MKRFLGQGFFKTCVPKDCENPLGHCWSDNVCGEGCSCGSVFSDHTGYCVREVEPCPSCGGTCTLHALNNDCGIGCDCVRDCANTNDFGGKCIESKLPDLLNVICYCSF